MAGISVGSVSVTVVPDTEGFVPRLRSDLTDIPDVGVRVTLDDMDAMAKLDSLKGSLDEIGHKSDTASVHVDTASATAELAKFRAEMDAATAGDSGSGNAGGIFSAIQSGADSAASSITPMVAAISMLAPALVPVGAAAAAGLGGIATMALSGAAGISVLYLGLSDVVKAVSAVTTAQSTAGQDAATYAQAQVTAANQVATAQRSEADATRKAADDQITAQENLATAAKAVAQARITGAQQVASAEQGLQSAEATLTNAVFSETQAQQALVTARQAAQRQLESYQQQLADGALQQRQDILNVQTAQQNLNAVLGNPAASSQQKQQAQLSFDQAKQALADQRQNYQNLQQDAAAAAKAGVDGATSVVAAQHQVVVAHQAVTTAQQQVVNAAAAVQRAQVSAADAVSTAIQHQGDVERQVAAQQITDQEAIASAQRAVVAALGAQQLAADKMSSSQQAAANALAKLTPAGQSLVGFITGTLMPAFNGLKDAAENGLLPGIRALLNDLMPALPSLTTFVGALAQTMGGMFSALGKQLTDPFWTQFFGWLATTAGPTLQATVTVIGNFVQGLAGMIQAMTPLTDTIGAAFVSMSKGFADFGTNTKPGSPLEQFISYAAKSLPVVGSTLEAIGKAFGHIVVAASPIGLIVLTVLGDLSRVIAAIPTPILTGLIAALTVAVPAILGLSLAMKIVKSDTVVWLAEQVAALATWVAATVASTAETLAIWGLYAAEWLASSVASMATFIAEHAVMAAAFVAENLVMIASATAAFIAENIATLGIIAGIGLLVAAAVYLATHWSQVWGAVVSVATDAWHEITGAFDQIVGFVEAMPDRIAKAAEHMWDGIYNSFKGVLDSIIGLWNDVADHTKFNLPSVDTHIPGIGKIGGGTIGPILPDIPMLALGGIVTHPTLAMVGEAGPEAVIPLSAWHGPGTPMTGPTGGAVSASLGSGTATGGIRDVTVIAQTNASPQDISREIAWLAKTGG